MLVVRDGWSRSTSADAGVRHGNGGGDERARRRRRGAGRAHVAGVDAARGRRCVAASGRCPSPRPRRPRGRHRPRELHGRSGRAGDGPWAGVRAHTRGCRRLDPRGARGRRSRRGPRRRCPPPRGLHTRRRQAGGARARKARGAAWLRPRRRRRRSPPRGARGEGGRRPTRGRRASPAARPLPRPACARARPGRGDRTALPARARRATEHRLTTIELRRLALSDLRAIEEIERRSYPTPWSRSMFAGELAKPSSICLGAFEADGEDGELCGYLVVSRYVDAWHVMNVAVDPAHRGRGIATMLLERLFELTANDARRGYTLEVRVSNATAISLYERLGFESRGLRRGYYTDNREDALIMWKDPVARPARD